MKRALIFLLLFVPILMAMLYLTGDLKRIAKVPSLRIEKKDPSLSEEIVRTEQGYVVRSVGEWA
ncbi:MAG: hypothetical protein N2234_03935, partial [Planctomycetota bacterium]|nr:hypothetical protein [Planctomycetota bacterium]